MLVMTKLDREQSLREIIRGRLSSGAVTRERPHFLNQGVAFQIGTGPAGDCGACGDEIRKGEPYFTLASDLRLHESCERLWEYERHRTIPGGA